VEHFTSSTTRAKPAATLAKEEVLAWHRGSGGVDGTSMPALCPAAPTAGNATRAAGREGTAKDNMPTTSARVHTPWASAKALVRVAPAAAVVAPGPKVQRRQWEVQAEKESSRRPAHRETLQAEEAWRGGTGAVVASAAILQPTDATAQCRCGADVAELFAEALQSCCSSKLAEEAVMHTASDVGPGRAEASCPIEIAPPPTPMADRSGSRARAGATRRWRSPREGREWRILSGLGHRSWPAAVAPRCVRAPACRVAASPGGEDRGGGEGGGGTGLASRVAPAPRDVAPAPRAAAASRGTPIADGEGRCVGGLEERCNSNGGRSAIAGGGGC
jgi:hypothetical protein